jgi:hypothetical protein
MRKELNHKEHEEHKVIPSKETQINFSFFVSFVIFVVRP